MHTKLTQFDIAILAFREAFRLEPTSLEVLINLGLALAQVGSYEEALSYFEKALLVNPSYYQIHLNIGVVYDKMVERLPIEEYDISSSESEGSKSCLLD